MNTTTKQDAKKAKPAAIVNFNIFKEVSAW
jgi:hypothetical protein